MITVQEAVDAALTYVQKFQGLLPSDNVRLEEFNYDDGPEFWYVTLSFEEPPTVSGIRLGVTPSRSFKTFKVDRAGQVVAMRIRNPLSP